MIELIKYTPNRLFTFGCSFTNYSWATWPEIIASELSVPLFNYGRGNAGNQFIFNALMQADNHYHFTKDDLIIVCWTNTCREDRYANGSWHSLGDIFNKSLTFKHPVTEKEYWNEFIADWGDPTSFLVRDLATIKATDAFLQNLGCQYHFLSVIDILKYTNLMDLTKIFDPRVGRLCEWYTSYTDKIQPSIYETIWNNDIDSKLLKEKSIHESMSDGHPLPLEHFDYLTQIFNHRFSDDTINKLTTLHDSTISKIVDELTELPKPLGLVSFEHLVRNKK